MVKHSVNWDWLRGTLKYDSPVFLASSCQTCELPNNLELPPKSLIYTQVKLSDSNHFNGDICLQRSDFDKLPDSVILSDINTANQRYVHIEIGNSGDEFISLPATSVVGAWAPRDTDNI